jgi:hypothetical protein
MLGSHPKLRIIYMYNQCSVPVIPAGENIDAGMRLGNALLAISSDASLNGPVIPNIVEGGLMVCACIPYKNISSLNLPGTHFACHRLAAATDATTNSLNKNFRRPIVMKFAI